MNRTKKKLYKNRRMLIRNVIEMKMLELSLLMKYKGLKIKVLLSLRKKILYMTSS